MGQQRIPVLLTTVKDNEEEQFGRGRWIPHL